MIHVVYDHLALTTRRENIRLNWMHSNATNIIRMSLEHVDTLQCIIVECSDLHVVGASYNPVLTGDKFTSSHWGLTYLE